jgi:alcohol dehydrogenase class IV
MSAPERVPSPFEFYVPTRIIFGLDRAGEVGDIAAGMGAKSLLLVTDRTLMEAGVVDRVMDALRGRFRVEVYDGVEPEPPVRVGEELTELVRTKPFDLVIGVGGGSVLDMAKLASVMATNERELAAYITKSFNLEPFTNPGLPAIAIPTTAGTGSEVSPIVMLMGDEGKIFISSRFIYPDVALIDPRLTVTLPRKVTAATGIDALTHMVEALMSTASNPVTDAVALRGVELVGRYLKRAYEQGHDLEARVGMCEAALLGGLSLGGKMVYGHSIAYTIAQRYHLPHGVSVATPLPYIMDYNLEQVAGKLALVAAALGVDTHGLEVEEAAAWAVVKTRELIASVGLPTTLKDIGVPQDLLPTLAEECVTRYPRPNNPRPLSLEDAVALYQRMWAGVLEHQPRE